MTELEQREEIRKVGRFIQAAEHEINAMGVCPRDPLRHPFDIVGLANVSKAFALAKACLKLLSCDLPDEAYGLSRSILECANNLKYLTADPDAQDSRTRDFVKYHLADKAFWAHYCLELFSGKPEEKEIREYMQQQKITPDPKPARRHWSGTSGFIWDVMIVDHPLDGPVTTKRKKISYAADYFQTSSFVHCSLPAIDNYAVEEQMPFSVSSSTGIHQTSQSTLFIVFLYLHSAIAYALFGMNLDRPPKLDATFQKTLGLLKPIPRHHGKGKNS
jgi:hypothetical protein